MQTAKLLVDNGVGKLINPINERQAYILSGELVWKEDHVEEFYEKFHMLLPELLGHFTQAKSGRVLVEECVFERGVITVVILCGYTNDRLISLNGC